MFTDAFFMRRALQEAESAYKAGEIPVGVVVVADSTIIAKAHNVTEQLGDVTAHAEVLAIGAASNFLGTKYLNQCTMYVTLEPCAMCAGAIFWAQVGRLVIGANDANRGFRVFSPSLLHPKTLLTTSVLEEECSEIVSRFFAEIRQKR